MQGKQSFSYTVYGVLFEGVGVGVVVYNFK